MRARAGLSPSRRPGAALEARRPPNRERAPAPHSPHERQLAESFAAPGADVARGTGLFVLTLRGDQISQITRFGGGELLARFGLPATLSL